MSTRESLRHWRYRFSAVKYVAKFERRRKIPDRFLDLGLLRRGFNSEEKCLYDFDRFGYADFISDYERCKAMLIDGRYRVLLGDKLFFERNYGWAMPVARTLATSHKGNITALVRELGPGTPTDARAMLARSPDGIVVKPMNASGGHRICMVRPTEDGGATWNGEKVSLDEVTARTREHGAAQMSIVVAMVVQSEWSSSFHPASVNTVRFAAGIDPTTGEAFLIRALLRIGVKASAPVDNFTAGGLSSMIDPETGALSRCATFPKSGKLLWHTKHPDTGVQIEGAVMPRWRERRDRFLQMISLFPETPYVGWDMVLTDDEVGFKILEGNTSGDVNLHQIHGPLLADPKTRAFFEHYRVVRPRGRR